MQDKQPQEDDDVPDEEEKLEDIESDIELNDAEREVQLGLMGVYQRVFLST